MFIKMKSSVLVVGYFGVIDFEFNCLLCGNMYSAKMILAKNTTVNKNLFEQLFKSI